MLKSISALRAYSAAAYSVNAIVMASMLSLYPRVATIATANDGEPTVAELASAREAYVQHGASYEAVRFADGKRRHIFTLPKTITDADLSGLPDLPFEFGLRLKSASVTDEGLEQLKRLRRLCYLSLQGTTVTDAGLSELKQFQRLTFLVLIGTRVTDDGLKELRELHTLESLDLGGTRITDAGLKELANITGELDLSGTAVTDGGLKELKDVRYLFLIGTRVTDAGLANITQLKRLVTLNLQHTAVTGEGLDALAGLNNLADLSLFG